MEFDVPNAWDLREFPFHRRLVLWASSPRQHQRNSLIRCVGEGWEVDGSPYQCEVWEEVDVHDDFGRTTLLGWAA